FSLEEVFGGAVAVGVIADEPRAVRELEHRADPVEARRTHRPPDLRAVGQIEIARLVAEGRGDWAGADTGPQVRRIVARICLVGRDLNLLCGRAIQLQLQIRVRHDI